MLDNDPESRFGPTEFAARTGVSRETLARLKAYAEDMGVVFQITDDLLDVEGTDEAAGKRVGKDAARGKLTFPGFLGVAESRRRAAELARQARDELEPLGPAARRLTALLQAVLERDR